jgi:isopenicillin-N epimerase
MNTVARSLDLRPGDEILTTDHEYGAVDLTWRYIKRQTGAKVVRAAIPLPVTTPAAFVDQLWSHVTPRTRLISISHITSPTALIFPVAAICRRARESGIQTAVDGAHAPGQIDLDLEALGADFYTGNCHKWLCAPKGSAFLYARPEHHAQLDPVIISWGWEEGNSFVQRTQWQGTRDLAAFLAVPDAIAFQQAHDWPAVRAACHALALETRRRVADLTGLPPISPDSADWIGQMAAMPVPDCDGQVLARHLWEDHRIEIPVVEWGGRTFVRISVQGYNTAAEADRLLAALGELLPVG